MHFGSIRPKLATQFKLEVGDVIWLWGKKGDHSHTQWTPKKPRFFTVNPFDVLGGWVCMDMY